MTTPVEVHDCQIAPGVEIDAIECDRPQYGLYSVAPPLPMSDVHMENGVEWLPYDCAMAEEYCNQCGAPGDEKTFPDNPALRQAFPFAVYGAFQCGPVGYTLDQIQARARHNLDIGEQRRVERHFWLATMADPDTVDLTPVAGAVSMVSGVAALEDWLGENSGCLGTIHMPRGLTMSLANSFGMATSLNDSKMRTHLGTLISAGGGYNNTGPSAELAPDGEAWMIATGPVHIWRGDVLNIPTVVNRSVNLLSSVVERTILAGFECGAAAIRVKVSGCGCGGD